MSLQTTSEAKKTAATSTDRKVPELSLNAYIEGSSNDRTKFINDFTVGLKDYGFIVLKDHPISDALLNKAYALVEEFFSLPVETKKNYALYDQGFQRGYTPFGTEHAKGAAVKDLKEFWHVGRDLPKGHKFEALYPPNIWPTEVPEFRKTMELIYSELDRVGRVMLEALTGPLEVEKDFFSKMTSEGNSILRLLHYPPIPEGVDPRCIRAAAHEDINLITLLVSGTTSGLQLLDRDGTWLDIESDPNSLIVDAGDMLARLTNEVIPSTTHRVVNPVGPNTARYSMPFFMHPNPDAMLTCLPSCKGSGEKYPPITSQDFLMQRLREIGLLK
ncbi:MAG TPA: 2-oxoglutarate and iron-dependent oxygenase domain-containing protein [Bdellovibrionales bacterium]|nr:2-oxoglutarate and iron-dependent oxygenase domain-containing protein [Bdellovibrionales bacterium]